MGQVDVIIVPDKDQIVRRQRHRGLVLLTHRMETVGQVDDAHFGMVECERLPVVIIEHDQLFLAGIILAQEGFDRLFQQFHAAISGADATDRRRIGQLGRPRLLASWGSGVRGYSVGLLGGFT